MQMVNKDNDYRPKKKIIIIIHEKKKKKKMIFLKFSSKGWIHDV